MFDITTTIHSLVVSSMFDQVQGACLEIGGTRGMHALPKCVVSTIGERHGWVGHRVSVFVICLTKYFWNIQRFIYWFNGVLVVFFQKYFFRYHGVSVQLEKPRRKRYERVYMLDANSFDWLQLVSCPDQYVHRQSLYLEVVLIQESILFFCCFVLLMFCSLLFARCFSRCSFIFALWSLTCVFISSFIVHRSSFIIHHSSFIVHHSSFLIHHSSFIIHRASFIVRRSSFTTHHSPFTIRRSPRDLLCGHTRDLLCGHTGDLLCGRTRDLLCGHTRDFLCG